MLTLKQVPDALRFAVKTRYTRTTARGLSIFAPSWSCSRHINYSTATAADRSRLCPRYALCQLLQGHYIKSNESNKLLEQLSYCVKSHELAFEPSRSRQAWARIALLSFLLMSHLREGWSRVG